MSVTLVVGFCEETILAILDHEFLIGSKSRLCAGQLSVETLCFFIHSLTVFAHWHGALLSSNMLISFKKKFFYDWKKFSIEILHIFLSINIIPEQLMSRPTPFDVIQPQNITPIQCLIVQIIH